MTLTIIKLSKIQYNSLAYFLLLLLIIIAIAGYLRLKIL